MTSVSCMGERVWGVNDISFMYGERVWGVNDISFMYGGEGLGGE